MVDTLLCIGLAVGRRGIGVGEHPSEPRSSPNPVTLFPCRPKLGEQGLELSALCGQRAAEDWKDVWEGGSVFAVIKSF